MIKTLLVFLILCGSFVRVSYAAGEQGALKNTHVSRFSSGDLALMKSRVMQALKTGADGETLEWKNDKSKASGSVTALSRTTRNGLACRKLRIVNTIDESSKQGVYRFCEKSAGQWKLVGPDKE